MIQCFYPHAYAKSVFAIDYGAVYDHGYRAVLFDIDNTLVAHGADATEPVEELLRRLPELGLTPVLLTNNNEARVRRFLRNVDCLFVCDADKPRRTGYEQALALLQLPRNRVLVVGDQVFTDILGANRCGLDSVLVRFIGADTETHLGKRRTLEQMILRCYFRSRKYCNRLHSILKPEESAYVQG